MQASYALRSTTYYNGSRSAQYHNCSSSVYHSDIRSLPAELLAGIFSYLLPTAIYAHDKECWSGARGRNWDYLADTMLVCRGWCAIVHSFPLLWTYVNIQNPIIPPRVLAQRLTRSGNLPLDVVIHMDQYDAERLGSLIPHIGRMRSLVIVVNGGNRKAETSLLQSAFSQVSAPMLEHLYILPQEGCDFQEDEAGRDLRYLFLGGLPKLKTFDVSDVAHWRSGLSHTLSDFSIDSTDTDLRQTTMNEVLSTLRDSSASLRTVSLRDVFDTDVEQDYGDAGGILAKGRINLSQLESLEIDTDSFSPTFYLLHSLALPPSSKLSINTRTAFEHLERIDVRGPLAHALLPGTTDTVGPMQKVTKLCIMGEWCRPSFVGWDDDDNTKVTLNFDVEGFHSSNAALRNSLVHRTLLDVPESFPTGQIYELSLEMAVFKSTPVYIEYWKVFFRAFPKLCTLKIYGPPTPELLAALVPTNAIGDTGLICANLRTINLKSSYTGPPQLPHPMLPIQAASSLVNLVQSRQHHGRPVDELNFMPARILCPSLPCGDGPVCDHGVQPLGQGYDLSHLTSSLIQSVKKLNITPTEVDGVLLDEIYDHMEIDDDDAN